MSDVKEDALEMALAMLKAEPELEIRSALKQAGSDNGIEYGPQMQEFVLWAEKQMGL